MRKSDDNSSYSISDYLPRFVPPNPLQDGQSDEKKLQTLITRLWRDEVRFNWLWNHLVRLFGKFLGLSSQFLHFILSWCRIVIRVVDAEDGWNLSIIFIRVGGELGEVCGSLSSPQRKRYTRHVYGRQSRVLRIHSDKNLLCRTAYLYHGLYVR